MSEFSGDDVRDLMYELRGVPKECDFCGQVIHPDLLIPEEGGEWICAPCLKRCEENENRREGAAMNETYTLIATLQQLVEKYGVAAVADALGQVVEKEVTRLTQEAEEHRQVLKDANARLRSVGVKRRSRGSRGTT